MSAEADLNMVSGLEKGDLPSCERIQELVFIRSNYPELQKMEKYLSSIADSNITADFLFHYLLFCKGGESNFERFLPFKNELGPELNKIRDDIAKDVETYSKSSNRSQSISVSKTLEVLRTFRTKRMRFTFILFCMELVKESEDATTDHIDIMLTELKDLMGKECGEQNFDHTEYEKFLRLGVLIATKTRWYLLTYNFFQELSIMNPHDDTITHELNFYRTLCSINTSVASKTGRGNRGYHLDASLERNSSENLKLIYQKIQKNPKEREHFLRIYRDPTIPQSQSPLPKFVVEENILYFTTPTGEKKIVMPIPPNFDPCVEEIGDSYAIVINPFFNHLTTHLLFHQNNHIANIPNTQPELTYHGNGYLVFKGNYDRSSTIFCDGKELESVENFESFRDVPNDYIMDMLFRGSGDQISMPGKFLFQKSGGECLMWKNYAFNYGSNNNNNNNNFWGSENQTEDLWTGGDLISEWGENVNIDTKVKKKMKKIPIKYEEMPEIIIVTRQQHELNNNNNNKKSDFETRNEIGKNFEVNFQNNSEDRTVKVNVYSKSILPHFANLMYETRRFDLLKEYSKMLENMLIKKRYSYSHDEHDESFLSFSKPYQEFIVCLYWMNSLDSEDSEFAKIPKDVLAYVIIPFISEIEVMFYTCDIYVCLRKILKMRCYSKQEEEYNELTNVPNQLPIPKLKPKYFEHIINFVKRRKEKDEKGRIIAPYDLFMIIRSFFVLRKNIYHNPEIFEKLRIQVTDSHVDLSKTHLLDLLEIITGEITRLEHHHQQQLSHVSIPLQNFLLFEAEMELLQFLGGCLTRPDFRRRHVTLHQRLKPILAHFISTMQNIFKKNGEKIKKGEGKNVDSYSSKKRVLFYNSNGGRIISRILYSNMNILASLEYDGGGNETTRKSLISESKNSSEENLKNDVRVPYEDVDQIQSAVVHENRIDKELYDRYRSYIFSETKSPFVSQKEDKKIEEDRIDLIIHLMKEEFGWFYNHTRTNQEDTVQERFRFIINCVRSLQYYCLQNYDPHRQQQQQQQESSDRIRNILLTFHRLYERLGINNSPHVIRFRPQIQNFVSIFFLREYELEFIILKTSQAKTNPTRSDIQRIKEETKRFKESNSRSKFLFGEFGKENRICFIPDGIVPRQRGNYGFYGRHDHDDESARTYSKEIMSSLGLINLILEYNEEEEDDDQTQMYFNLFSQILDRPVYQRNRSDISLYLQIFRKFLFRLIRIEKKKEDNLLKIIKIIRTNEQRNRILKKVLDAWMFLVLEGDSFDELKKEGESNLNYLDNSDLEIFEKPLWEVYLEDEDHRNRVIRSARDVTEITLLLMNFDIYTTSCSDDSKSIGCWFEKSEMWEPLRKSCSDFLRLMEKVFGDFKYMKNMEKCMGVMSNCLKIQKLDRFFEDENLKMKNKNKNFTICSKWEMRMKKFERIFDRMKFFSGLSLSAGDISLFSDFSHKSFGCGININNNRVKNEELGEKGKNGVMDLCSEILVKFEEKVGELGVGRRMMEIVEWKKMESFRDSIVMELMECLVFSDRFLGIVATEGEEDGSFLVVEKSVLEKISSLLIRVIVDIYPLEEVKVILEERGTKLCFAKKDLEYFNERMKTIFSEEFDPGETKKRSTRTKTARDFLPCLNALINQEGMDSPSLFSSAMKYFTHSIEVDSVSSVFEKMDVFDEDSSPNELVGPLTSLYRVLNVETRSKVQREYLQFLINNMSRKLSPDQDLVVENETFLRHVQTFITDPSLRINPIDTEQSIQIVKKITEHKSQGGGFSLVDLQVLKQVFNTMDPKTIGECVSEFEDKKIRFVEVFSSSCLGVFLGNGRGKWLEEDPEESFFSDRLDASVDVLKCLFQKAVSLFIVETDSSDDMKKYEVFFRIFEILEFCFCDSAGDITKYEKTSELLELMIDYLHIEKTSDGKETLLESVFLKEEKFIKTFWRGVLFVNDRGVLESEKFEKTFFVFSEGTEHERKALEIVMEKQFKEGKIEVFHLERITKKLESLGYDFQEIVRDFSKRSQSDEKMKSRGELKQTDPSWQFGTGKFNELFDEPVNPEDVALEKKKKEEKEKMKQRRKEKQIQNQKIMENGDDWGSSSGFSWDGMDASFGKKSDEEGKGNGGSVWNF